MSRSRGDRTDRASHDGVLALHVLRETPAPDVGQTERDREENRRTERAEDRKADGRRWRPTVPEQQLWSVLAALGERYGDDYEREYKIKGADGQYLTHVDYAWPSAGLVIEVYGGPHHKPFFDPEGTRGQDDADRIDLVKAAGWQVLIVRDSELVQKRWQGTLDKVERFLARGRAQGKEVRI